MVTPAWVIVAGGVGRYAGQDRANFELARYLVDRGGAEVHIVAHRMDDELRAHPAVTFHQVWQPLGAVLLGCPLLDAAGCRVARQVSARIPGARVITNGANCKWADVAWIHSVLSAWPPMVAGAPWWGRIKERIFLRYACGMERSLLPAARLAIANSNLTKEELVRDAKVTPEKVRVVYYGAGAEEFAPVSQAEREQARAHFELQDQTVPVIAFVGALGYSSRKGFDTLLEACRILCDRPEWNGTVLAAGGGRLAYWGEAIRERSLTGKVQLLGHIEEVPQLLAAADILVSPAKHEAFGLNVHEALCRGIPAIVSAKTGVAEVYPESLNGMLLPEAGDSQALAEKIRWWFQQRSSLAPEFSTLGETLRKRTWRTMAAEFVEAVEETKRHVSVA